MLRAISISAIPPQPSWTSASLPLHLTLCKLEKRLVYGCATGIVVRMLPDQVIFGKKSVEAYSANLKHPITCAAVSPDGKALAGGDTDGNCHIWIKERGTIKYAKYVLDNCRYVKMCDAAISPDSRRVVLVGVDKYSKTLAACLAVDGGMSVGSITGHTKGILTCHFRPVRPSLLVTGGLDGLICVHEGPPYKLRHTYALTDLFRSLKKKGDVGVACLRWSNDGKALAVGTTHSIVGLLDESYKLRCNIELTGDPTITSLCWGPGGHHLAVSCSDISIRILKVARERAAWSLQQIDILSTGTNDDDAPRGVCWSGHGWITIACKEGHMKGWKVVQGKQSDAVITPQQTNLERQLSRALRRQEEKVAGGEEDDEVETDDETPTTMITATAAAVNVATMKLVSRRPEFIWYGPKGGPVCADYDRESGKLVVGTSQGFIMFFDTDQTVPYAFQVSRLEQEVTVRACLNSRHLAAAVTADGCIRFYKVKTTNIKSGDAQKRVERCFEVSNGRAETTFRAASKCELILTATGELGQTPLEMIFVDHLKYVAVFGITGTLSLFNCSDVLKGSSKANVSWSVQLLGKPLAVASTQDGTLFAVALIPASDYPTCKFGPAREGSVTIDFSKPLIEIYEVDSGESLNGFKFICVLEVESQEVTALAVNDEGSLLAYADQSRRIVAIELESQDTIIENEWASHTTRISDLHWAPNGSRLISASTNEMYIWDINQPLNSTHIRAAHSGSIMFARFIFNNIVISAGSDGLMQIHEIAEND